MNGEVILNSKSTMSALRVEEPREVGPEEKPKASRHEDQCTGPGEKTEMHQKR